MQEMRISQLVLDPTSHADSKNLKAVWGNTKLVLHLSCCEHAALVYLEEIAEISPAARITVRPRYGNLLAELLSQTKPGAEPRQAPRALL